MTAKAQLTRLQALRELRAHVADECEFNRAWIGLHLRDGHPQAAETRRKYVAERERWIEALDQTIAVLEKSHA
jgi:hypothetical protein